MTGLMILTIILGTFTGGTMLLGIANVLSLSKRRNYDQY